MPRPPLRDAKEIIVRFDFIFLHYTALKKTLLRLGVMRILPPCLAKKYFLKIGHLFILCL